VLADFKDDGKWANVVEDCVPGQLVLVEAVNHVSHAEFALEAFSMTVDDIDSYLEVTRAVIERKLYPITIETNVFGRFSSQPVGDDGQGGEEGEEEETIPEPTHTNYLLEPGLAYVHDDVNRRSPVERVVVGPDMEIGAGCRIVRSSIGSHYRIGDNVTIEDCVIWDNVNIQDGVAIRHSIVASSASIQAGVQVEFGCILGFGVTISTHLPRLTRISSSMVGDEPLIEDNAPEWLRRWGESRPPLGVDEETTGYAIMPKVREHDLPGLRLWYRLSPGDFPIPSDAFCHDEHESEGDMPSDEEVLRLNLPFQAAAARVCAGTADPAMVGKELSASIAGDVRTGIGTYARQFSTFLDDRETMIDFLFWWQGFCAKDVSGRGGMYVDALNVLTEALMITSEAFDDWITQQEEMTEAQRAIFRLWWKHR